MTNRFGLEIKRLRQQRSLTQRDLAVLISVTPGFLSQLENGLCAPPGEQKIVALAEALGVDKNELFSLAERIPAGVITALKTRPHLWADILLSTHT